MSGGAQKIVDVGVLPVPAQQYSLYVPDLEALIAESVPAAVKPQAVICARVSSIKQVGEGSGLDSRESRCREFAVHKRDQ